MVDELLLMVGVSTLFSEMPKPIVHLQFFYQVHCCKMGNSLVMEYEYMPCRPLFPICVVHTAICYIVWSRNLKQVFLLCERSFLEQEAFLIDYDKNDEADSTWNIISFTKNEVILSYEG